MHRSIFRDWIDEIICQVDDREIKNLNLIMWSETLACLNPMTINHLAKSISVAAGHSNETRNHDSASDCAENSFHCAKYSKATLIKKSLLFNHVLRQFFVQQFIDFLSSRLTHVNRCLSQALGGNLFVKHLFHKLYPSRSILKLIFPSFSYTLPSPFWCVASFTHTATRRLENAVNTLPESIYKLRRMFPSL